MKLIIPMAGRGTRVRPHSHTVPKPLLPVAGTMIVERLVETFIRTMDRNIEEIVYILGPEFGNSTKDPLRKMSARHGAKCIFRVQEIALGTAHAVYCARKDLDGEVIIAFADTLFDSKEMFNVDGADSVIWLKKVEDPSRFGVAVYEGEKITGFVEKPAELISDLAIIGVYYFKDGAKLKVELQYVLDNDIKGPSGEYYLTDALDRMIHDGKLFKTATVDEWLDCGTLSAWLETTGVIVEKEAYNLAEQIEAFAKQGTKIIPPVYLAKDVTLEGVIIGPNVSVERGCVIKNSQLSHSIIREQASLDGCTLAGSTVGAHTKLTKVNGEIHVGDHSIITTNNIKK
ncbi:MAG: glucose-1-phosphate thymidylyltransferase [Balneola sp.]|nr:glucose-1-phosphate thymidylyltransferase [Balneola sp.]|tara:strand:+ start:22974 stop:24002 length:1029 start_codon:yes stop_codon:yes gene_type:complete